jgi:hypothetical protein
MTTPTLIKPTVKKIKDYEAPNNVGILYWHQDTLDKIAELSGPLAVSNEFQIHYWALVIRFKFPDDSIIDVALPTVIYNYDQEVSPAHIDFELKDVNAVSEVSQPLHNVVVNKLLATTSLDLAEATIEYLSVPLNTMHRHPTGVSSFSGTDLRKDHLTDTGIVFPLKTASLTPSFSSIIYNNPVSLVHTEYRIADGNVDTDEGISYYEGGCITYVKANDIVPSTALSLCGKVTTVGTKVVTRDNVKLPQVIEDFLSTLDYTPSTDLIKADHVTKKTYAVSTSLTSDYKWPKSSTAPSTPYTEAYSSIFFSNDVEVIDMINKDSGLNLKTIKQINEMSLPELQAHAYKIERYYYVDDGSIELDFYKAMPKDDLIETIVDTQENIISEYNIEEPAYMTTNDLIPKDDKIRMLMLCGIRHNDIEKATDEEIDLWYDEVT